MSDIAAVNAAFKPSGEPGGPFEVTFRRPTTTAQIGRGQFATIDVGGNAVLNGGAYVLPAGIGYPAFVSSAGSPVEFWIGTQTGMVQSTGVGDGFTDADVMVPFWIKDAQTPARLPMVGGVDRAIGGFVMGMEPGSTTQPRLVTGPLAGVIGLGIHAISNEVAGTIAYAVDASASTDQFSASVPNIIARKKYRGAVTSVEIVPTAALAATSGNDAIITLVKVDTTGTVPLASSPVVATFTTTTALVAGVVAKFVLTGTVANLLFRTTDKLGWYRTHNGSGAVIPLSTIQANFQVI